MTSQRIQRQSLFSMYDKCLLFSVIILIVFGSLMVASASMAISERQFSDPFHFLFRQGLYLLLGTLVALIVVRINMAFWRRIGSLLLLSSLFLLVLVLVPGIGRNINGSSRWIGFGTIGLQVSEFVKLSVVIYMSGYLVRHHQEVCDRVSGFVKPMLVLGIISILLLLEPDFGAMVVIMCTALGMMYLAGARIWKFILLLALVILAFAFLAMASPYRMARLTTFLNPWANQFNSGYQLTQSLIAFGRGGLFGVGLGDSIQKLFYLPEAHTDFLFAVLAEELGLIGILMMIGLYVVIVGRALFIGRRAQLVGHHGSGYVAYGFSLWLGMQAIVNMGVNSGILPTKGLTLPLFSYGGSSMLIVFIVIAILLRIDYETRFASAKVRRH